VRAYGLAFALGIAAAVINLKFADLMLTALAIMAATMFLGFMFPQRPWRWLLVVAGCVPMGQLLAYFSINRRQPPAQLYESCLGFAIGSVGAFGGSVGRRLIAQLWPEMDSGPELPPQGRG
jgi:hypothetical protein